MSLRDLVLELGNEAIDSSEIHALLQEIAYEGFDAATIVRLVTAHKTWKEDVRKMIVIALCRGNKPEKMMKRMSEKGKTTVKELVNRYKIVSGRPGRNDITFTRVAAAFAPWTVQAIEAVEEFLPVTGSTMDSISAGYPRPMMHPSFGGLIDATLPPGTATYLADAHRLFLIQFSRTINVNLRSATVKEVVASFDKPLTAAIYSKFLTSDDKRNALMAVGVIDKNLAASANVRLAADTYRALNKN
ncbi:nucleocapsid [Perkerra virus]|uniref:Nucleoprotein n=2 Tax=Phlebovirus TaxID=11584 RepID=A0A7G8PYK8_9VIRU|nr:nucleocapsid [Perkerra virus]QNJ99614.1 nucleocapsid [Perkerra virus]